MFRRRKQGVTLVTVLMSLFILLAASGLVIDTGIVLNAQNELQKQVETTALFGAQLFEPKRTGTNSSDYAVGIDTSTIDAAINEVFNISKSMNFTSTIDSIEQNPTSKAVRIKSHASAPVFFMSILGVSHVRIDAQATAISSPFYLSPDFPQKPVKGSLLKSSSADTDIRKPLGYNKNLSLNSSGDIIADYLYGAPDNKAVSLGAGGYITMRLPSSIVDEEGYDLYIRELGNMEGYFVFAGNDADPDDPYVNEGQQGAGIQWQNISCTGTPEGDDLSSTALGSYIVSVKHLDISPTDEVKFYGSGYFDLGVTCNPNIYDKNLKSAKYLKIIDDNEEDGFMANFPNVPTIIAGEHSSVTPGADIDAIAVLHHTRLVPSSAFDTDTDGDGLIDILESILGTDINLSDSDADGITDDIEYSGWFNIASPTSIIDNSSNNVHYSSPLINETNKIKPIMFY